MFDKSAVTLVTRTPFIPSNYFCPQETFRGCADIEIYNSSDNEVEGEEDEPEEVEEEDEEGEEEGGEGEGMEGPDGDRGEEEGEVQDGEGECNCTCP